MAMLPIDATCAKCNLEFNQIPTRTSLGFQRLKCPVCKQKATYPLTSGYRTLYWLFFVLLVLILFMDYSQGGLGLPGGLGLAIIYALFMDRRIRKRTAKVTNF